MIFIMIIMYYDFISLSGGSKIKFHLIDNFLYFLLSFGKP